MSKKVRDILIYSLFSVALVALLVSTIVLAVQKNRKQESINNAANATYDFYITLGTMPTLYATINAYNNKNPNTYMWFYRGNTISKEYSADFIHYFSTQSNDNNYSTVDYFEIRNKIREIKDSNPGAKFHLYCDDLRVRFILDFVAAGIDFENLQVTFLSDGTGSYSLFSGLTEEAYVAQKESWKNIVKDYEDNRNNKNYTKYTNKQAMELQSYVFYLSTFSNVNYWIQHPDYLKNTNSDSVNRDRYNMNIVKKDPRAMYLGLDTTTREDYQKVVLANALVDSDTLHTLSDAVNYFDTMLSGRDKEVVLILGTSYDGLEHNENFINKVLEFYTPTESSSGKATYKGKEYDIVEEDHIVDDDGRELALNEVGVYLFFKGHPAYPANQDLQTYFSNHNITVLPHRTPVEVLFWMYDVKVGGYSSTSFLSAGENQTEFFFGAEITDPALAQMQENGFFSNTTFLTEN